MLNPGDKAPTFTLKDSHGTNVSLSDFAGRWVVVYFYPKDDTPGCTIEAKEFSDLAAEYAKKRITVLGISRDSVESHDKFVCKYDLGITLLSDPEHAVIEAYGAWQEKLRFGAKSMGVARSTVLIDTEGTVTRVWPDAKPAGHAKEVLASV